MKKERKKERKRESKERKTERKKKEGRKKTSLSHKPISRDHTLTARSNLFLSFMSDEIRLYPSHNYPNIKDNCQFSKRKKKKKPHCNNASCVRHVFPLVSVLHQ